MGTNRIITLKIVLLQKNVSDIEVTGNKSTKKRAKENSQNLAGKNLPDVHKP